MRETTFALKEFTVRWVLSSFIHSRGLNPHFAGCHKATSLALTSPLGATAACPVSYWSPLYGCSDDILNSLHLKLVHNHFFHPNSFSSRCLFSQWLYFFRVTQVLIFGGSNQTPDMTVTSPLLSIPLLLFWSLVHWSHCLWTTPMLRVTWVYESMQDSSGSVGHPVFVGRSQNDLVFLISAWTGSFPFLCPPKCSCIIDHFPIPTSLSDSVFADR